MNMNNKTIYVQAPLRSEKRDITRHFRDIKDRGGAFKIYGVQFDTEKQISDSLCLTLLSFGNLFSGTFPNVQRTKNIIRKQFYERNQVKIETYKSNIRLSFKEKSYLFNPKTLKLTQSSSDIYLNRVFQTPVEFYPGLCKIKVGSQTFGTKQPVQHFDSNQWAFVVGGQSSIQIFSNGSTYSQKIKPLKLKFGPGGLYIINDKYQIQNVYEDRYGSQNYNLTQPKRNSEVIGDMFDLVDCGKVMFLVQTDCNSFLHVRSISANIQGGNRIQVNYIGHNVLAFGAFNQNDSFVVAYFIYEFRNQVFYQQHRFAIKAQ